MSYDAVTTISARHRHHSRYGTGYTLCDLVAIRPGEWGNIDRAWIDALPACLGCARVASQEEA
ncbi:hypothetical protein [Nocardia sp. NPDC057030]|uniref:hypothetical protein n=1 Tax=unclassified Nocardia TaxID=2637762 RepID=UPI00362C1F85